MYQFSKKLFFITLIFCGFAQKVECSLRTMIELQRHIAQLEKENKECLSQLSILRKKLSIEKTMTANLINKEKGNFTNLIESNRVKTNQEKATLESEISTLTAKLTLKESAMNQLSDQVKTFKERSDQLTQHLKDIETVLENDRIEKIQEIRELSDFIENYKTCKAQEITELKNLTQKIIPNLLEIIQEHENLSIKIDALASDEITELKDLTQKIITNLLEIMQEHEKLSIKKALALDKITDQNQDLHCAWTYAGVSTFLLFLGVGLNKWTKVQSQQRSQ